MCYTGSLGVTLRQRQEIMGLLGAKGGPRSWQVAGMYFDLLGPAETFARTPYRRVQAPYGDVLIMKPEDLLVERVLVSVSPGENLAARDCAKAFIAVALREELEMDWTEVRRLASLPEYRNLPECEKLVQEVADELQLKNPLRPDSD
jgi:hypothetical protein